MMRGETEFDADKLRKAAEIIAAHAGEEITSKFPEGTGGMPSEAKDTVWTDWEEFETLSNQLEVAAEGLQLAAANGMGDMGGGAAQDTMRGGTAGMMGDTSSMMGDAGSMMGDTGGMMGGEADMMAGMTAEQIGEMSANAAFEMTNKVCSTCHTKFRKESD
jgi:cytochrome c556